MKMVFLGTSYSFNMNLDHCSIYSSRNEHRDFKEEVIRLRVLRGKQRKNMRLLYPKRMPELAPCCKQSSKK